MTDKAKTTATLRLKRQPVDFKQHDELWVRVNDLEAQLRQEREAKESHECGDTCDALQAQVAQLNATLNPYREFVQKLRAETFSGSIRTLCDDVLSHDAALAPDARKVIL